MVSEDTPLMQIDGLCMTRADFLQNRRDYSIYELLHISKRNIGHCKENETYRKNRFKDFGIAVALKPL